ncbi:MAG: hypothetical protein ABMA26_16115, partial [Limisphaerales bacterium]
MKTLRLFAFCLLPFAFALTGCGTISALKQPFVTTTNAVPTVITIAAQTNSVAKVVEATTNTLGNVVTITPPFVTNLVTITPASYVTNWATNVSVVVNPGLSSALATVETVNKFNPTPSAPIIDLVLYVALGGFGWWARLKTKAAAKAQEEGKASLGIAQTLVMGIEESKSAETKAAVSKISEKLGNAPAVNALV